MLLIFPAERRINWSNPPLATLGLILINLLVFVIFQSNENDDFQKSIDYYLSSPLVELEYKKYYQFKNPQIPKNKIGNLNVSRTDIQQLMFDDEWNARVDLGIYEKSTTEYANWKIHRQRFEKLLSKVTFYGQGLRPANYSLWNNFSYMFLHADISHLLGNMVFLLIFGFSLEIILGVGKYLGVYLLTGLASGAFYTALNLNSYMPLIGASGAVSGLMGSYAVIYGFKRIQFFYWFLSFFNYIKLPALIVLPVWILKEIWEYTSDAGSSVAYMAHVGGLVSGALLAFVFKHQTRMNQDYLTGSDEDDDRDPVSEELENALELMRRLRFDKAQQTLQGVLKLQPANIRALELSYHIQKLKPLQSPFKAIVEQIFSVTRNEHDLDQWAHQLYTEFRTLNPQGVFSLPRLIELCGRFTRSGFSADAEAIIELLEGARPDTQEIPEMILNLSNFYLKNNQRNKAKEWLIKLEKQYKHNNLSKHATVMLNKIEYNRDV
jgi:membrane associated rhomboid family serine protease